LFLEEIRKYFGEAISLYFSFLGFYTFSLVLPALFGILHLFFPESASNYSLIFFCIFNVVWVTVTLELWKRKCSELAYVSEIFLKQHYASSFLNYILTVLGNAADDEMGVYKGKL
jgi:hypothetical protein